MSGPYVNDFEKAQGTLIEALQRENRELHARVKKWEAQEVARAVCCAAHEKALYQALKLCKAFQGETHGVPMGQEDAAKGYSVFNWRRSFERLLVEPLAKLLDEALNSTLVEDRRKAEEDVHG